MCNSGYIMIWLNEMDIMNRINGLLTYTYVHQAARFLVQNSPQREWLVYRLREHRDPLHSNSPEKYSCCFAYLCLETRRLVPEKKVVNVGISDVRT